MITPKRKAQHASPMYNFSRRKRENIPNWEYYCHEAWRRVRCTHEDDEPAEAGIGYVGDGHLELAARWSAKVAGA